MPRLGFFFCVPWLTCRDRRALGMLFGDVGSASNGLGRGQSWWSAYREAEIVTREIGVVGRTEEHVVMAYWQLARIGANPSDDATPAQTTEKDKGSLLAGHPDDHRLDDLF